MSKFQAQLFTLRVQVLMPSGQRIETIQVRDSGRADLDEPPVALSAAITGPDEHGAYCLRCASTAPDHVPPVSRSALTTSVAFDSA